MTPLLPTPADTADTAQRAVRAPTGRMPSPRRRVLIGFGVVVALFALLIVAVAAPHLNEGTGDRTYHPTTFAAVDHHYEFGIGSLTVDLRDVDFPPGVHVVTVDHGIGSARVFLPDDVSYDVSAEIDAGEVAVLGESEDGFDSDLDVQSSGSTDATVIVDLQVDIGYGSVSQD